jgi:hypothetical protein
MKKIVLAFTIFILATIFSYAQDFSRLTKNDKTGLVTITEIIELEGFSKDAIYNKTKLWITQTYKSPQDVLQLDDKENGLIVIKAISEISPTYVHYTFTIKIKDGKIKLDTNHIYSDSSIGNANYGWGYAEEWIEGKANGYKQPKGSLKRLSNIANATVDHIYSLYEGLEQSIKESLIDEEEW